MKIDVEADERDASGDFLLLEILNISRAGPAIKLAVDASASDGWLDLVSVRDDERDVLVKTLGRCLANAEHEPVLDSKQVKNLRLVVHGGEIRLDDAVVLERDKIGRDGVEIEVSIRPNVLRTVLPGHA